MILPIIIYGNSFLRKKCIEIDKSYKDINFLINNMYDTMYQAKGIGLSAPQIGLSIRLFIIEYNNFLKQKFKKVFINPIIIKKYGYNLISKEGCLSIPNIIENIKRKNNIIIEYYDENWKKYKQHFNGFLSIIIQHEYDHIEGKLFIDNIFILKNILIKKNFNLNYNLYKLYKLSKLYKFYLIYRSRYRI
ncbi:peptide deformylase [Candidatus Karelsulcia muelleri DMIN]|uniref:Peptide deformylase n=1 Tax=Karelsulcia muelleri (strain DMIN) TaxID=641892 RepID=D5D8L4_KARMD|nr:peptide deformylase [Candidatus Karelsulcia muelleri DMIN]